MYGEKTCSACAIQKGYFGDWFSQVPYKDCDEIRDLCDAKNIHAYPTWEDASGKQYKGAIVLDTLSRLAGCSVSQTSPTPAPKVIIPSMVPNLPELQPDLPPQQIVSVPQISLPFHTTLTSTLIMSAFVAGFLSFFAPCLLPLYPAYMSVITGFTFTELYGLTIEHMRRRVFLSSLVFASGFALIFTLLGATGSLAGVFLLTHLALFIRISGVVLCVLGLMQLGVITTDAQAFDYAWNIQRRFAKMGYITAFVTGITAALSWIPCVGPLLSSILLSAAQSATITDGIMLLAVYSTGLTIPFVLTGLWFPSMITTYQEHRGFIHRISQIAGLFLIAYGILLISNEYQPALTYIKHAWEAGKNSIFSQLMVE